MKKQKLLALATATAVGLSMSSASVLAAEENTTEVMPVEKSDEESDAASASTGSTTSDVVDNNKEVAEEHASAEESNAQEMDKASSVAEETSVVIGDNKAESDVNPTTGEKVDDLKEKLDEAGEKVDKATEKLEEADKNLDQSAESLVNADKDLSGAPTDNKGDYDKKVDAAVDAANSYGDAVDTGNNAIQDLKDAAEKYEDIKDQYVDAVNEQRKNDAVENAKAENNEVITADKGIIDENNQTIENNNGNIAGTEEVTGNDVIVTDDIASTEKWNKDLADAEGKKYSETISTQDKALTNAKSDLSDAEGKLNTEIKNLAEAEAELNAATTPEEILKANAAYRTAKEAYNSAATDYQTAKETYNSVASAFVETYNAWADAESKLELQNDVQSAQDKNIGKDAEVEEGEKTEHQNGHVDVNQGIIDTNIDILDENDGKLLTSISETDAATANVSELYTALQTAESNLADAAAAVEAEKDNFKKAVDDAKAALQDVDAETIGKEAYNNLVAAYEKAVSDYNKAIAGDDAYNAARTAYNEAAKKLVTAYNKYLQDTFEAGVNAVASTNKTNAGNDNVKTEAGASGVLSYNEGKEGTNQTTVDNQTGASGLADSVITATQDKTLEGYLNIRTDKKGNLKTKADNVDTKKGLYEAALSALLSATGYEDNYADIVAAYTGARGNYNDAVDEYNTAKSEYEQANTDLVNEYNKYLAKNQKTENATVTGNYSGDINSAEKILDGNDTTLETTNPNLVEEAMGAAEDWDTTLIAVGADKTYKELLDIAYEALDTEAGLLLALRTEVGEKARDVEQKTIELNNADPLAENYESLVTAYIGAVNDYNGKIADYEKERLNYNQAVSDFKDAFGNYAAAQSAAYQTAAENAAKSLQNAKPLAIEQAGNNNSSAENNEKTIGNSENVDPASNLAKIIAIEAAIKDYKEKVTKDLGIIGEQYEESYSTYANALATAKEGLEQIAAQIAVKKAAIATAAGDFANATEDTYEGIKSTYNGLISDYEKLVLGYDTKNDDGKDIHVNGYNDYVTAYKAAAEAYKNASEGLNIYTTENNNRVEGDTKPGGTLESNTGELGANLTRVGLETTATVDEIVNRLTSRDFSDKTYGKADKDALKAAIELLKKGENELFTKDKNNKVSLAELKVAIEKKAEALLANQSEQNIKEYNDLIKKYNEIIDEYNNAQKVYNDAVKHYTGYVSSAYKDVVNIDLGNIKQDTVAQHVDVKLNGTVALEKQENGQYTIKQDTGYVINGVYAIGAEASGDGYAMTITGTYDTYEASSDWVQAWRRVNGKWESYWHYTDVSDTKTGTSTGSVSESLIFLDDQEFQTEDRVINHYGANRYYLLGSTAKLTDDMKVAFQVSYTYYDPIDKTNKNKVEEFEISATDRYGKNSWYHGMDASHLYNELKDHPVGDVPRIMQLIDGQLIPVDTTQEHTDKEKETYYYNLEGLTVFEGSRITCGRFDNKTEEERKWVGIDLVLNLDVLKNIEYSKTLQGVAELKKLRDVTFFSKKIGGAKITYDGINPITKLDPVTAVFVPNTLTDPSITTVNLSDANKAEGINDTSKPGTITKNIITGTLDGLLKLNKNTIQGRVPTRDPDKSFTDLDELLELTELELAKVTFEEHAHSAELTELNGITEIEAADLTEAEYKEFEMDGIDLDKVLALGTLKPVGGKYQKLPSRGNGGGNGGGGGGNTTRRITDGNVPLAEIPTDLAVLGAYEEIGDGEIPLAVLPMTGDMETQRSMDRAVILALVGATMAGLGMIRRKEEDYE